MEPLQARSLRPKGGPTRLTRQSKLFKTIINAIQEKKGANIVSLDLRNIHEAVADFFIVCEAPSAPQIKAIADHVAFQVKEICDENVYHIEGIQALQWVLIDYVNVVIHVMHPEQRRFYLLEEMWSDAPLKEHKEA